jgi:uncharacterized protein YaaR (DUF327 family)
MMLGKNRSAATLRAYKTDIRQFVGFLHENLIRTQKSKKGKNREDRKPY